jgi:hypothetical protein
MGNFLGNRAHHVHVRPKIVAVDQSLSGESLFLSPAQEKCLRNTGPLHCQKKHLSKFSSIAKRACPGARQNSLGCRLGLVGVSGSHEDLMTTVRKGCA